MCSLVDSKPIIEIANYWHCLFGIVVQVRATRSPEFPRPIHELWGTHVAAPQAPLCLSDAFEYLLFSNACCAVNRCKSQGFRVRGNGTLRLLRPSSTIATFSTRLGRDNAAARLGLGDPSSLALPRHFSRSRRKRPNRGYIRRHTHVYAYTLPPAHSRRPMHHGTSNCQRMHRPSQHARKSPVQAAPQPDDGNNNSLGELPRGWLGYRRWFLLASPHTQLAGRPSTAAVSSSSVFL